MSISSLRPYIEVVRLDKPIGIFLLLWPTLIALNFAGNRIPSAYLLLIFSIGTVVMRSAGCIINDILDRDFDRHVTRTQNRPITSSQISLRQAYLFFIVLSTLALCLVSLLNSLCFYLAIIGFVLTCVYPLMKRFIQLPQAFLGLTFSWGIPIAYAATINTLPPQCWWLFLATALLVVAYDTEYALVDKEDDLKMKIKSSAILFGKYAKRIILCLQLISLSIFTYLGYSAQIGWPYYVGIASAIGCITYQQYLLYQHTRQQYFQAFLNNHWLAFSIFMGLVMALFF